MKKKFIVFLSTIVTAVAMIGCSNNTGSQEEKPQDVNFIKDVEKSFSSRSDYVEKAGKGKVETDDVSYFNKCVDIELDILSKYKDALFSDATLRKLALDYIDGVEIQKESIKYYHNDFLKYSDEWQKGYDMRSVALIKLVDEYKVEISESDLRDLRTNSQVVHEKNEFESELSEMVKNIKFEQVRNEYGFKYYSAIVENTTDKSFESFSLDIKLLDTDGVAIDSQYVYTSNWNPGEKVKLEFMTDANFETLKWEQSYFLKE